MVTVFDPLPFWKRTEFNLTLSKKTVSKATAETPPIKSNARDISKRDQLRDSFFIVNQTLRGVRATVFLDNTDFLETVRWSPQNQILAISTNYKSFPKSVALQLVLIVQPEVITGICQVCVV